MRIAQLIVFNDPQIGSWHPTQILYTVFLFYALFVFRKKWAKKGINQKWYYHKK
jgi:hypothetical protein